MKGIHNKYVDKLMEAIVKIETKEDCCKFFEDLCTVKEILDMSKRLEAAKLLSQGMSYKEIHKAIDVSTATLSRVNKALNYGVGGYEKYIKNNKEEIQKSMDDLTGKEE